QPERAEGIYLYDSAGNRYMDFTSGIGVTNTGHCHPRVVKAIQDQCQSLIFGQMNIVIPPVSVRLVEKLNEITPGSIDSFFLSNSGAEAVEASIKLARHATGKRGIVVFQGSFHGRTAQTMAMTTSKYIFRHNYQPLPSGIYVAPFPYSYYYGWDDGETTEFCIKQLENIFHGQVDPGEVAAVIIEPVLGEGGYVPSPVRFLKELRRITSEHEIMLIADEVQSGFGRTGKMFSFEHAGIEPDILVMAKGLGSGMPISGIGASQKLMSGWIPGSHGGTFGGGTAVAAAASLATIEVILEEGLLKNTNNRGVQLLRLLQDLQGQYSVIGDVRGMGLMVATEFTSQGKPDRETAKSIQRACLKRNLLLLTCGTYENVIRWIPPLIVTDEQINDAVSIFKEAITEVVN
ncbi:MAG: aspartate aminotransferase family protein, partial [Chloroflexota bacterium]